MHDGPILPARLTLRPAAPADAEDLARLMVQLHQTEVPGVLRGPVEPQVRLFQALMAHELAGGSHWRYLADSADGRAVASASLRLAGDPGVAEPPPGITLTALRTIGPANSLRMLASALRTSLFNETVLGAGQCYIYSVVVGAAHRRRGLGLALMEGVEAQARALGAHSALLRVVVGNTPAKQLYKRLGYRVIGRTPAWADWLTYPTELMRKIL